jgi:hypothetical protein
MPCPALQTAGPNRQHKDRLTSKGVAGDQTDQAVPLLGAPTLPNFDKFTDDPIFGGTDSRARTDEKSPSALRKVAYKVPEAYQEAPRLPGIPTVPSASAVWDSPRMKLVSIWLLIVSIFEICLSLLFVFVIFGALSLVAGVLGIIAGSFHLCESCGGREIDSNLSMVRFTSDHGVV